MPPKLEMCFLKNNLSLKQAHKRSPNYFRKQQFYHYFYLLPVNIKEYFGHELDMGLSLINDVEKICFLKIPNLVLEVDYIPFHFILISGFLELTKSKP